MSTVDSAPIPSPEDEDLRACLRVLKAIQVDRGLLT